MAAALSVLNTAANSAARRSTASSNRLRRLKLELAAIQRRPQVAHHFRQRPDAARVDLALVFQRSFGPHDSIGVRATAQDGHHLGERLAADRPAQADVLRLAHRNPQRHLVFGKRDLDPVHPLAADLFDAHLVDHADAVRRIDHQIALAKRPRVVRGDRRHGSGRQRGRRRYCCRGIRGGLGHGRREQHSCKNLVGGTRMCRMIARGGSPGRLGAAVPPKP